MCKSPGKSPFAAGSFLPKSPIPVQAKGCLWMGDLGVSLHPPVHSPPSRGPALSCMLPNLDTCQAPAPNHPRDKYQRWGCGQTMVELKPAGHAPANPVSLLCHCRGLQGCRFPLGMKNSHPTCAKGLEGKATTLSQLRATTWLLESTMGRKGKGN